MFAIETFPTTSGPSPFQFPSWTPLTFDYRITSSFGRIISPEFFRQIHAHKPTLTMMRLFNARIAKLRQRGAAPEWLPAQDKFQPDDFVHLMALALDLGSSEIFDLGDLIEADNKIRRLLDKAITCTAKELQRHDAEYEAYIINAVMKLAGFINFYPSGFFMLVGDRVLNESEESQILFDWALDTVGEQALILEAKREIAWIDRNPIWKSDYARHFLDPSLPLPYDDKDRPRDVEPQPVANPAPIDVLPSADAAPITIARAEEPASAKKISDAFDFEIPDGVEISNRAWRELRAERRLCSSRFQDALHVLAAYRAMKRGEISYDAYQLRALEAKLQDQRCFFSPSNLKTFEADYSTIHNKKKVVLERHLKWGKGNNPITALRVYYTYDATSQTVIVGSAPRHLPVT